MAVEYEPETWQRTMCEALRSVDPDAQFNVGMAELDCVVGQGASYRDTLKGTVRRWITSKWKTVADMPEPVRRHAGVPPDD